MAKKMKKSPAKTPVKAPAASSKKAAKPAKPAAKDEPKKKAANPPATAPAGPAEAQASSTAPAAPVEAAAVKPKKSYATAESMAKAQRSISVSEFFAKNRHLLGFDNPRKALLTTVKEAVDNSLDACEEAGIHPVVEIWIEPLSETHFRVTVQDNGPGIVRQQVPHIFGRLLYGSKFHRLRMSRGQQGIGISAAGMYGLLTTGQPVKITSRTSPKGPALYCELQIDTRQNKPDIIREAKVEWDVPHGTKVAIELEAKYQKGRQSVDDYLEQTAVANPHVTLVYHSPDGRTDRYEATAPHLPPIAKEIMPHPQGVELGFLIKMMQDTRARTVQKFLTSEFSRVSPRVAKEILDKAAVAADDKPSRVSGEGVKAIYQAIQQTKIMAPATDCVVPVGEEQLLAGLKQVVKAEYYAAASRSPAVYRGNPFLIEAAVAYGKAPQEAPAPAIGAAEAADENGEGAAQAPAAAAEPEEEEESLAKLIRFANRVPLLYQQSACAIYKAVVGMNWKLYGLPQSRGALPAGDLTIVVHMASVWVPFTSESKEAIASYPEILKELRLALQECGRQLGSHIRRAVRMNQEMKKRGYIEKYIPAIGEALRDILELNDRDVAKVCNNLKHVLERTRKF